MIVIEFLEAENRLLKERLRGKRIRFTDAERALLARKAKGVGRKALKERTRAHGRGAEAEHREILAEALARPRRRSPAEVLASIPGVGTDADFERVESERKAPRVLD